MAQGKAPILTSFQKHQQETSSHSIEIKEANIHNLKNFNAKIPLGKLTCISGLSGSGKSTLLYDLIYKELSQGSPRGWAKSTLNFSEVTMIDQGTVARSPRSNPVLYADAWTPIKEAFSRTEQAKASGFHATDFSFNTGQGRCDSCMGMGYENVEMQFYLTSQYHVLFAKVNDSKMSFWRFV